MESHTSSGLFTDEVCLQSIPAKKNQLFHYIHWKLYKYKTQVYQDKNWQLELDMDVELFSEDFNEIGIVDSLFEDEIGEESLGCWLRTYNI